MYRVDALIPVSPETASIADVCLPASAPPQDQDGSTPLHLAAQKGDARHVRVLLKKGASVNVKDTARMPHTADVEGPVPARSPPHHQSARTPQHPRLSFPHEKGEPALAACPHSTQSAPLDSGVLL